MTPYDDSSKTRFGTWPHRFALQSSYGQAISWSIVLSLGDPLPRFRRLKGFPAAERPSMRSPRSIRRNWYCCGETDWHSHRGVALFLHLWAQAVAVQSIYGSDCDNMAGFDLKLAVSPPRVIIVLQTVLALRALCEGAARR